MNTLMNQLALLLFFFSTYMPLGNAQQSKDKVLTQYLFDEFSEGTLRFRNGSTKRAVLNFNTITGKIVYYQDNKYFDLVNSEVVDTIYLNTRKFVYDDESWLEVLLTGVLPLYAYYKGSLMSPPKQGGYGTSTQTSSVTSITTIQTSTVNYDMKLPDGYTVDILVTTRIKVDGTIHSFLNERQLIKVFPGKESSIRQFIKKNKTDFDNSEDLVELIHFISGF